jgi:hypothetical protein
MRALSSMILLLLVGCGPSHYAGALDADDITLSRGGNGYGARDDGAELLRFGAEAVPHVLPLAEAEAERDDTVHHRTMLLALVKNAAPPTPPDAHGTFDTDVRLTPFEPRVLEAVTRALRSRHSDLRSYARWTLNDLADARLFAVAVEDLSRAIDRDPPTGPPDEAFEARRVLCALGIENGKLIRPAGMAPTGQGDPRALPAAWGPVFSGSFVIQWDRARADEVVAGLRAWLAERKDLPPQVPPG